MMIDYERRRQVMKRSQQLGHCICDPRQSCPCDLYQTHDICQCAGERQVAAADQVRLTAMVQNPGCAAKISQDDLHHILQRLTIADTDPRVLVGRQSGDDAGVYQLTDEIALVQTVDVFTPTVDDPYAFGQIAAANSLSDVYAMGGTPLTALAVIAFPIDRLQPEVMTEILQGGLDKLREAGVPLVGGHSLKDPNLKFGFAITGQISPQRIITNSGARPGDWLVLTKPLGVGVIAFAHQLQRASLSARQAIAESMTTLNQAAASAMLACEVGCATDVTGFGLLGHLGEVVEQSQVGAEVYAQWLPAFPEVAELLEAGVVSGALERNRRVAWQRLQIVGEVPTRLVNLACDPQTSGGLLICVSEAQLGELLRQLQVAGVETAAIIGRITAENPGVITLMNQPAAQSECDAGGGCGSSSCSRGMTLQGDNSISTVMDRERDSELTICRRGSCGEREAGVTAERPGEQARGGGCGSGGGSRGKAAEAGSCDRRGSGSSSCSGGFVAAEVGQGGAATGSHCGSGGGEGSASPAAEQFRQFNKVAAAPGALGEREKELLLVALAAQARCGPSLQAHWQAALRAGGTREQLDEAVWLAVASGGASVLSFFMEQKATLD